MKKLYLAFLFVFCLCISVNAQTPKELNQAKTYYKNKEFDKALPIFQQAYNAKPNDPSLNLWCGVCLVETGGDLKKAEECLLVASKRNLQESYLYLGDMYIDEYRVSEAREFYDRYAKARPREKETTLGERYEKLNDFSRLISRTEDIQIIDSMVVDKSQFLKAYKLSPDAGFLSSYKDFFDKQGESVVYSNEKGTKVYFGQPMKGKYVLSTMDKLLTGFGNEKMLDDNNFGLSGDTNYPFVMMDGTTIYFSGIDENGIGGYDIYVTRYNLNTNSYLNPEILNMPFNSTANDYLMVVDENKGVGWFATDRFQPEGKVCIYTFIPNEQVTLVESDDEIYRENRAKLTSIRDTWKKGQNYSSLVTTARKDVEKATEQSVDFTFIVDDKHTYHAYREFQSASARNLYFDVTGLKKELASVEVELGSLREDYADASASVKKTLSNRILILEKKQSDLKLEIQDLEKTTRNEEILFLK